jgi:hypothetical protein
MHATCPACDRAVGALAHRCPYCGERLVAASSRRRAGRILAATALLSLGWAIVGARGDLATFWRLLGARLHSPGASVILVLATTLLLLPLCNRPGLPGVVSAESLWRTWQDLSLSLAFSLGLLLCALLLCLPAARLAAGIALFTLLPYPLVQRRPAYPLVAVPLVVLAWLVGSA